MSSHLVSLLVLVLLATATLTPVHGHDERELSESAKLASKLATRTFQSNCKRGASSCVLQNEVTEGPYYYDTQMIRQDIT